MAFSTGRLLDSLPMDADCDQESDHSAHTARHASRNLDQHTLVNNRGKHLEPKPLRAVQVRPRMSQVRASILVQWISKEADVVQLVQQIIAR